MDHPIAAKRLPPGSEQALCNEIAVVERMILERQEWVALEPCHGQEPPSRQFGMDARHSDVELLGKHRGIERDVLRLALIIQFLAQPGADLLADLARIQRPIEAPMDHQQQIELSQIGLDR